MEKVTREIIDRIALVRLNRPKAYNAFDFELVEQFGAHLTAIAANDDIRGVVITGSGKAFCAGGDLKWVMGFEGGARTALHTLAGRLHAGIVEIRRMKKPVIAAINGIAAGAGFSLALVCDFRVMDKSAAMRQAYSSAGLCLDGGGSFMLPRLVGLARAMEIAAFDKPISSDQALEWGMVTRVADEGKSVDEALDMARKLAQGSLHSFGWSKELLTNSFDSSFESHIERERVGISTCGGHPDGIEGMNAFAEKRKPVFNKS